MARQKDVRTEAALKRCLKFLSDYEVSLRTEVEPKMKKSFDVIVEFKRKLDARLDCEVRLSDFWKKRTPVVGLGKKLAELVRVG